MQRAFFGSLMSIAEKDASVIYVASDSGEGGLDLMFRRNFPKQVYDFGIAESTMIGASAGLALSGKIPFVYAPAPFMLYRAYEFIRDDICLQNANVKLFGSGSGLSVSALGPTHHSTEDIAILRTLPNLKVYLPATPIQVLKMTEASYKHVGPTYVRIEMIGEKEYFDDVYEIDNKGFDIIESGKDVALITFGTMLEETKKVQKILSVDGIDASVILLNMLDDHDEGGLTDYMARHRLCVTIEEHNLRTGIGDIIDRLINQYGVKLKNIRIGLDNSFAKGYGTRKMIRRMNRLNAREISVRVRDILDECI